MCSWTTWVCPCSLHLWRRLIIPSSGCSTLLKTIAGETYGFQVSPKSYLNYQGISASNISTKFRGEAIYTAEVDAHFPQLNVGDTLYFAALARAPRYIPGNISRTRYAKHLRDVSSFFCVCLTAPLSVHRLSWQCSGYHIQSTHE